MGEDGQSAVTQTLAGARRKLALFGSALAAFVFAALITFDAVAPPALRFVQGAEAQQGAPDGALRLISQSQYLNTIRRVFGRDVAVNVRFAPVSRTDGLLAVGAWSAVLTTGALDPLESSARLIAQQVVEERRRDALVPCRPANREAADAACARAFFTRIGRLLYRRPLSDDELDMYVAAAGASVGHGGDFYDGLASSLSAMLVSPHFLFIREQMEADPASPGGWRLDGYSKASRLSFLLWNTSPDDELLRAAERGDLHSARGLQRQFDRMIASPLYQDGVRAFFNDFLILEGFDNLAKDSTVYPAFSVKAVEEAREQVLRTVADHLVAQHGDYRELFTTRRTFLSSELATLYRIPVNVGAIGWIPYEFPEGDPRSGLLSQIGFLAQYAHPARSSATRRGRAIREVLLCQRVPDPPPNVDFSAFENPEVSLPTARERVQLHLETPACAGCHRLTDPIGLAFENFDGAGQFRLRENGELIDTSGSLDGTDVSGPAELGQALSQHQMLTRCVVNRLYAYSTGRSGAQYNELLNGYRSQLDTRGYRFDDMLRLIVFDPSFFTAPPTRQQTAALAPVRQGGSHADQNQ